MTPKEKVALLVLGLTLVLCVLTLLAGSSAYDGTAARNPVFAVVGALCRALGGGIVGLYALVMVWSGLIYFKGERVVDISPIGGRAAAAFAVMVGISGALGIAHTQTAGALGGLVGGALGATLGGTLGIILMLGLIALGVNLAGQGAWFALREPVTSSARGYSAPSGVTLEAGGDRIAGEPPMLEDGDPSPDERTHVVTQAMEEIERSQGVTIVDVQPTPAPEEDAVQRPTIGEEVESAPPPEPESEEAAIQRGLREVSAALAREEEREKAREDADNPLSPAPALEDDEDSEDSEDSEEAEPEQGPEILVAPPAEVGEEIDEEVGEEIDEEEEDPRYYEPSYEIIERRVEPASEPEQDEDPGEETGFAATDSAHDDVEAAEAEEPVVDVADEAIEEEDPEEEYTGAEDDDPYARGGLLKRLKGRQQETSDADPDRTYSSFDWRGRPID